MSYYAGNGDVKVAVMRTRMYTAPPLNRDIVYVVTQDPLVLILSPGGGGLFLNGGIEVETTVCPWDGDRVETVWRPCGGLGSVCYFRSDYAIDH